jgi:hypothetical protein
MDALVAGLATLLGILFVIGGIGCLFVIPRTAVELFHTFFEPDTQDEIDGRGPVAQP